MDIHDTAFSIFTALVARQDLANASDESRAALGREAYKLAEAFMQAKDTYIRELPVGQMEGGF